MDFKKFLCKILIFFSFFSVFSQESDSEQEKLQNVEREEDFEVLRNHSFFLTAGPMLMINTDSKTKSAPSPIMYELGFGVDFFQQREFCGQARLSFFTNYYLWDGENAQPAEVENRTATGLSFMIDLLGGRSFNSGNNQFTILGGLGILARFALLSSGVEPDDYGSNFNGITTTASEDVSSINSWFYSKMNFLYPQIAFSYLRTNPFIGNMKFGAEFRTYVSLGGITAGDFLDGMIFSLAGKIQF